MARIDDAGVFRKDERSTFQANVSVEALRVFLVRVERRTVVD